MSDDEVFDEFSFEERFRNFLAQKMQAVWRGKKQRAQFLQEKDAAVFIQGAWRRAEARKAVSRAPALLPFVNS